MSGWAPPRPAGDDWKDRQVIRLDSLAEVRAAQDRWKHLRGRVCSALAESAHALLCYSTRDGRLHVWVNDALGQALDLSGLADLRWLQAETIELLGCGTWRL